MAPIKNVAIAGASGNMGQPILQALLDSKQFSITVLTRHTSTATFPPQVTVAKVDYTSLDSLTHALRHHDALISTLASLSLETDHKLADACLAAGVARYLPSSFGCDLENPFTRQLPVFGHKVAVEEHVKTAAKSHPDFSYTFVYNSAFLDWGLEKGGFLLGTENYAPQLFDGGERPFSSTLLAHIADAIVGVLTHPEETKNRAVRIGDTVTTQNQLLEIAKRLTPGKEWKPVNVDLGKLKEEADAKLQAGKPDEGVWIAYLATAIWREGYGGQFEKSKVEADNKLLGVKGVTEADLEELLRKKLGV